MDKIKVGRPTNSHKNMTLKFRLDEYTISNIDKIVNDTKTNRSDVIRQSIPPVLASKTFNNMLSMHSLQQLEEYSQKCFNYFENLSEQIETSLIEKQFPAFISASEKGYVLYIKYPTYKIRVISEKNDIGYSKIKESIEKSYADKDYYISLETNCVIYDDRTRITLPEILCLREKLKDNELLAKILTEILKENFILYEIWPSYYLKPKEIQLKNINGIDYVIPSSMQKLP